MSVSEHERTQLFRWFEEHMGKERAQTMMALVPPVGWGDMATRRDLELLEGRLDAKIDRLDVKIDRLDTRIDGLDARIDGIGGRLGGRLELVERRLDSMATAMVTKQDLAELRAELAHSHAGLQRTLVTWMLASQATVVATVGVLLAVFR
jgi:hypothetical protein